MPESSPPEPTPAAALDAAERTPAVGRGIASLEAACLRVARSLAEHPALGPRLTLQLGRLARAQQAPQAVRLLARAAAALQEAGDAPRQQEARIELAMALGDRGDLDRAAEALSPVPRAHPRLPAALALLSPEPDLVALQAALPGAHPDDRIALLRALARAADRGGDRHHAAGALAEAVALAAAHGADGLTLDLAIEALALSLEAGDLPRGLDLARGALAAAQALEDDVACIAVGSTLAALCLQTGALDEAAEAAQVQARAAQRRGNPLALADAALTVSSALLAAGRDTEAVHHLVAAGGALRAENAVCAVNLIKGRLGELRDALGAERFDAALWSA